MFIFLYKNGDWYVKKYISNVEEGDANYYFIDTDEIPVMWIYTEDIENSFDITDYGFE